MPAYIALLRAVNVGGTGKLPMVELKAMCMAEGFSAVSTYIASGNVVFSSPLPESRAKARLGKREIYVSYGSGMGRSKFRIPAAESGTARNINTIAKLAEMAAAL